MLDTVHERLDAQFDDYEIKQQLHDVPPHVVHEITVNGHRAVLKRDTGPTGSAAMEGTVMRFVDVETTVPVPTVIAIGEDSVITEWHPEAPRPAETSETDDALTADETWAYATGRALASLHDESASAIQGYGTFEPTTMPPADEVTPDDADASTSHRESVQLDTTGSTTWHEAAMAFVRRHGSVASDHGHADVVDRVLDRLATRPDPFVDADAPVCCHGWASPEHVTVRDAAVTCMVDFEHAIAAPAAFDYHRTMLTVFDDTATSERRAFTAGYESIRDLPADSAQHRSWYAILNGIYFFESLSVQDQHDPETTAERARYIRSHIDDVLDELD